MRLTRWIPELLSAVAILGMASPAILESRSAVSPATADQISAIAGASPGAAVPPLVLPLAGLGLLAFVALAVGRERISPRRLALEALIVALVAIGAAWFRTPLEIHPLRTLAAVGLVGLGLDLLLLPKNPSARIHAFKRSITLFLFVFALGLRWGELLRAIQHPVDPDVVKYLRITREMSHPFDTEVREPLPIWGLKTSCWLFGDTETSLRVASVFFSLAALVAAFLLALRLFAFRIAFLTALLLSWWPLSRAYSVRGLRDELLAACTWFFLAALWRTANRTAGTGAPAEIVVAFTVVGLTSLTAVQVAALLLLWATVFWRRVPWRTTLFCLLASFLTLAPYLLTNLMARGDPFLSVNVYARGFANWDFCDTPGFPSCAEIQKDLYLGERLTGVRYVFQLHSPSQIVSRLARGYGRILRGHFPGVFDVPARLKFLLPVYWLGVLALLLVRSGRYLVTATLVWLGPIAFLAGSNRFPLDWRLLSPVWVMQASAIVIFGLVVLRKTRAALARTNGA